VLIITHRKWWHFEFLMLNGPSVLQISSVVSLHFNILRLKHYFVSKAMRLNSVLRLRCWINSIKNWLIGCHLHISRTQSYNDSLCVCVCVCVCDWSMRLYQLLSERSMTWQLPGWISIIQKNILGGFSVKMTFSLPWIELSSSEM